LEVAQVAQETTAPAPVENKVAEQGTPAEEIKAPESVVEEKPKSPEERIKELEEAIERTKKGSQKAIDRQTAARKALEEKYNQLQQQLSSMPNKQEGDKTEADFDTWNDYVQYEAQKLADKRIKEAKEAELKQLETQKSEALRRDLESKEAKFREVASDYDNAIKSLGSVANDLNAAGYDVGGMSNMILQFDNPPAMFYELAKVDGLIDDIVKLPALGMMRELVKLEMTLQNKPLNETKEAPRPINTVKSASKSKDIKSMSGKELLERFNIS